MASPKKTRCCNWKLARNSVVVIATIVVVWSLYHHVRGIRVDAIKDFISFHKAVNGNSDSSNLHDVQHAPSAQSASSESQNFINVELSSETSAEIPPFPESRTGLQSKGGHIRQNGSAARNGQTKGISHPTPMKLTNKKTQRLPQVLVIGAKKCGTGTLKYFLSHHPSIAGSATEAHFFDVDETYSRGLQWYQQRQVWARSDQLVMEGSPAYFHTTSVPERIKQMNESIRLLLILRDPVVRLISDYVHTKNFGIKTFRDFMSPGRIKEMDAAFPPNTSPDFEWLMLDKNRQVDTTLELVKIGLYAEHLKRYLQYFNMEQIHVIDGAKFSKTPWDQFSLVENFLHIDNYFTKDKFQLNSSKGFYCLKDPLRCMGEAKGMPHPNINSTVLDRLNKFYRPHNEELYKILNRKFDW